MKKVKFQLRAGDPYIQLIQLLKAANLVFNGAEAQHVVVEGMVVRNGEVELRKRAKIVPGDRIVFQDTEVEIVAGDEE
ncbi:MAG: RNA-binding S4 domain-containing protein [Paludibacteraceae bacterium]|nr:RNA-binding S4 domain-containing protein [Paludibacteraceae bacterium]